MGIQIDLLDNRHNIFHVLLCLYDHHVYYIIKKIQIRLLMHVFSGINNVDFLYRKKKR